jgi:heme-degrading monooxygenase HmoA
MYARVTLLEIDTVRASLDEGLEVFVEHVLPDLRRQPGYAGVYVLTTPEGKALLMSLWESDEDADASTPHGFYPEQLARHATLFRAPPGRERYEVSFAEAPALAP